MIPLLQVAAILTLVHGSAQTPVINAGLHLSRLDPFAPQKRPIYRQDRLACWITNGALRPLEVFS